jgi:DNA damage-inducible protein 1
LFLDVGPDMTIDDFKAVIAIDSQTAPNHQALYWNGNLLADGAQTLADVGIKDADMVLMQIRRPATSGRDAARRQAQGQPAQNDAERLRLQALEDPGILERLRHQRPELAEAVHDPRQFREVWNQLIRAQNEREDEKNRLIARLNADPFDIEAQREIEEMIRKEAVMQNLHDTMENMPEGEFAWGITIFMGKNAISMLIFYDSIRSSSHALHSC